MLEIRAQMGSIDGKIVAGFQPPLRLDHKQALREDPEMREAGLEDSLMFDREPWLGDPFTEIDCHALRVACAARRLMLKESNLLARIKLVLEKADPDLSVVLEQGGLCELTADSYLFGSQIRNS